MDAKITAAFELVNAYAKEKSHDVQRAMLEKYIHLRNAALEGAKNAVTDHNRKWLMIGGIAASATALGMVAAKLLKKDH